MDSFLVQGLSEGDIDDLNTVDSTRVADATLVYVGDGQVTDASKMGWLARFFISAVWPF